ncbi:cupredoxin domain-containing protein [Microbulbifer magnicolonia]|uniref:cupredoxin domain-containing protein n=1 Tax=Microbulbifer magnicolonia TaxID=3109744 RepID=UPI002B400D56|nr:cupredoxin domain-containing protein [Microbulbifer sp. GG15]
MLALLINGIGLVLIAAILWWFWLGPRRQTAAAVSGAERLQILVKDGVYEPDHIRLPAGEAATLHFRREDPSPCAEWVLFPDLEVSAQLSVHSDTAVKIPAAEPGEYPFTCQMQMYRGTLVVE